MLEKPAVFRGVGTPVLDRAIAMLSERSLDRRRLRDALACLPAERETALPGARILDENRGGDWHEKELISLYTMAIRQCESLLAEALDR